MRVLNDSNRCSALAWLAVAALAGSCAPSTRASRATDDRELDATGEIALAHADPRAFVVEDDRAEAATSSGDFRIEGSALLLTPTTDVAARIETDSLARADASTPLAAREADVDDDGAAVLDHGDVRERFIAFDAHVAQQWTFDAEPEGAGPLVVRVGIEGARFRSSTDEGLVLDVGGRTLLYGHGAFVDAEGHRTPVRAKWDEGRVALEVPADVLAESTYPATLDPIIRIEREIDAPVYGSDRAIQSHPAVASNGTDALAVWSDYRTGRSYDVFGVRVGANGQRLEAGSFPIVIAGGAQWRPAIAVSSSGYVVVWEDHRDGGSAIYGARVSSSGDVLDEGGVRLSEPSRNAYAPRIASDGTDYLIVWEGQEGDGSRTLRARRMSGAGTLAPSFEIASGATAGIRSPAVAYGGSVHPHYVVAWVHATKGPSQTTSRTDVRAARVTPAGALVDTTSIVLTNDTFEEAQPSVAVSSANALVCYVRSFTTSGEPDANIDCRPLALATGTPGLASTAHAGVATYDTPSVANTPQGGFGVIASASAAEGANIESSLLDANGVFLAGPYSVEASNGTQNAPSGVVIAGGTFNLIVFQDDRDGSTEIYARYFGVNQAPSAPAFRLSTAAVREDGVDVAWGGSGYFAVWHDARTDAGSILGGRVLADGRVIDSTALSLSETLGPALEPSVAGGDGVYLAVWREAGRLMGRRVGASGDMLEADPVVLRTGSGLARPDVVWSGSRFLVAWEEYIDGNYDVYARRYGIDGVADAPAFRISSSQSRSSAMTIATDGSAFYVAWSEGAGGRIEVTRVPGTNVGTVNGSIVLATAANGETLGEPSASFGAGHMLVVWEARSGAGVSRILGRTLDATAGQPVLGAERIIASDTASLTRPRIAYGSSDFLVAWERSTSAENSDLQARRVDALGNPVASDPLPVTVASTLFDERGVSLTSAGAGRWLLGFERFDPSDMFGNVRARLRFIDAGEGCSSSSECSGGDTCIDGVCCDTACGGGELDCAACSVAAGGTVDGTCGPLRASLVAQQICRASGGTCDVAERCSASSTSCPTDALAPAMQVCRAAIGICDLEETCSGSAASCPVDAFIGDGPVCEPGDLAIAISAAPSIASNQSLFYSIGVTSVGDGPVMGTITVTHPMPAGFSLESVTSSGDWLCDGSSNTATCTRSGPWWPGASTAPIQLWVLPGTVGSYVLSASLSGMEEDENGANDLDEHSIQVTEAICATLTSPANGTVTMPGTATPGQSATFGCNAGYSLTGSSSLTCLSSGAWSGAAPTCTNVNECAVSTACGKNLSVSNVCTDAPGSFTCACGTGFAASGSGASATCVDVNECASGNGGCSTSPMVSCTNTVGGRTCGACPAGYAGDGTTCANVNECSVLTTCGRNLSTSNVCTDSPGSFACTCASGFAASGSGASATCVDVNECASGNGGCSTSPMVSCTNTIGGRTCGACPGGYAGDGTSCANANECATLATCARDLSASNTCTDTTGGYTCGCTTGFVASGSGLSATCADVNECATGNGGCITSPMGICTNTPGSRTCACPGGYSGDGFTCANINECAAANACGKNLSASNACTDTNGGYTCSCGAGYVLSGTGLSATCVDADECATNNGGCLNGGTCQNLAGSFACSCPPTWTGIDCETFAPNDEAWIRVTTTTTHAVPARNVYSTRGTISVVMTRIGAGRYSLGIPQHAGGKLSQPMIAVTATSNASTRCQWGGNTYPNRSTNVSVTVNCTTPAGAYVDSTFNLMLWRATGTTTTQGGYAGIVTTPVTGLTTVGPSYRYASSGVDPTYDQYSPVSTGRYRVNFPNVLGACTSTAPTPIPIATVWGGALGDWCTVESYVAPTASVPMSVNVACFSAAGVLKDSMFSVMVLPQDTTNPSTAWAQVSSAGAITTSTCTSTNTLLGARNTTSSRTSTGVFSLVSREFSNASIAVGSPAVTPAYDPVAFVTSVGASAVYCHPVSSATSGTRTCPSTFVTTTTGVNCYNVAGTLVDAPFNAVQRGYLQPACP